MRQFSSLAPRKARLLASSIPLMFAFLFGGFFLFLSFDPSVGAESVRPVLIGMAVLTFGMGLAAAYRMRIRTELHSARTEGDVIHLVTHAGLSNRIAIPEIAKVDSQDAFPLELVTFKTLANQKFTFAVADRASITRRPSRILEELRARVSKAGDSSGADDDCALSGPTSELPLWARCVEILPALTVALSGLLITLMAYGIALSSGPVEPPPLWFALALPTATAAMGVVVFLILRAIMWSAEVHLRADSLVVRLSRPGQTKETHYALSDVVEVSHTRLYGFQKRVAFFFVRVNRRSMFKVRQISFVTPSPQTVVRQLEGAQQQ
ncbi:hypothetical protein KNO81_40550 [Paraburkholderia sediminicola]|nr:hypothetical protein [Paraburkholderia sediminicola]